MTIDRLRRWRPRSVWDDFGTLVRTLRMKWVLQRCLGVWIQH